MVLKSLAAKNRQGGLRLIMGNSDISQVKALTFDVFGTVVNWRDSIIREGVKLAKAKGLDVDWPVFADRWRGGYGPSMERVRTGDLPWTNIDTLHRMILDELLEEFGITGLSEDEKQDFNKAWHRLDPWPDSAPGLTRLKKGYVISTLSNGNVALLTNMAKWGGLPWDCILSAELFKRYKRDPKVYQGAAKLLGLPNDRGDDGGGAQVRPEVGAGGGAEDGVRAATGGAWAGCRD